MSLPDQLEAFEDCLGLYERALADKVGARACFGTYEEAKLMQLRMHQARALERRQTLRLYPASDLRHGKSEFDCLRCRVLGPDEDGDWWVYVDRHGQDIKTIEALSEL